MAFARATKPVKFEPVLRFSSQQAPNGIHKCSRSQGAFAASSVCDRIAFA
jgi:hypothetical protein